jgi:23S rRNA pseudouridine2605 synthase
MSPGVSAGERGELLAVAAVRVLRHGQVNVWLEIRLNEGRNRQIRRICESLELPVLRLIRVAIGSLCLGELPKGAWRQLTAEESLGLTVPSE